MEDPSIYYITRFVPSYRRAILDLLNDRMDGRLVVCAGDPPPASGFDSLASPSAASYREIRLRNYWFRGGAFHAQAFGQIFSGSTDPRIAIIEESPRSVTLPFLLKRCRSADCATVLWGHFSSNDRPAGSRDLRDRYRMWMTAQADCAVCYSVSIAEQLKQVIKPERVYVAPNTLETKRLSAQYDSLHAEGKQAVRKRLGLQGTPILLYLGRLVNQKGVDRLVDVASTLAELDPLLLIVGDGPERTRIEDRARTLGVRIRFTGALTDDLVVSPYVYAADLLLNPGPLGLSVVHAFCMGIPVVAPATTGRSRYHGPEGEYVHSFQNGILARDDVDGLSLAARQILDDLSRYSTAALSYAHQELSVERMLDGLRTAIDYALSRH